MEILDVVNEKDEIIGRAPRDKVYKKLLTHRIVNILVFNDKKQLALQLRSKSKKSYPNYWESAGGHVISSESYEEAAKRELKEELGLVSDLKFLYKFSFDAHFRNKPIKKIIVVFSARNNGPFNFNSEEIEKIEFLSMQSIRDMINEGHKIHPELVFIIKNYFR